MRTWRVAFFEGTPNALAMSNSSRGVFLTPSRTLTMTNGMPARMTARIGPVSPKPKIEAEEQRPCQRWHGQQCHDPIVEEGVDGLGNSHAQPDKRPKRHGDEEADAEPLETQCQTSR